MTVISARLRAWLVSALMVGIAVPMLAGASGCRKKTPAEKFGDKMEDIGNEVEEEVDG